MNAQNAALAFVIASYASQESPAPIVVITETKPQKLVKVSRAPKANKSSDPAPTAETTITVEEPKAPIGSYNLPAKGTVEAAGYLKLMRSAGCRVVDGKPIHDPSKVRGDKLAAIAAFIGYDLRGDFGTQELAANFAAKRQLSPIQPGMDRQEVRSAQRSLTGYVKGMPDNQQKILRDLQGREQLAVDTMLSEQRLAHEANSQAMKTHHTGLALLEKERLEAIQTDIRKLVG